MRDPNCLLMTGRVRNRRRQPRRVARQRHGRSMAKDAPAQSNRTDPKRRTARPNDSDATYQQAVADRSTAQLNLDRTVLRAPVNGFVTNLTLDKGQYASVGTKVMALIDSDSYRVTGYFEETKIQRVKPGALVKIYLMSSGPPLLGHVESRARGITDRDNPDGPELLANANPTFEWVRLAQRIPVRIHIDDVPKGVLVSSGMTCTVVVEVLPRQWGTLAALRRWSIDVR